jgi:transcriptional regulator with XRE-family HTH domain
VAQHLGKLACSDIGARLNEARIEAGLSMSALGARARVAASTINTIEKGRAMPAADTIERLARALGLHPCWLAYGAGPREAAKKE